MFKSKTKQCQNCKSKFTIKPEDFEFYKKISVPEPTFCPDCRLQRRMSFRKEAPLFYKRKCDATGKDLITVYNPNSPIKVYDQKYWFSDKWDPMEYGMDYNFNKPFFEQFKELLYRVPQPATINDNAVDSSFCNENNYIKSCYLVTNAGYAENLAFSNRAVNCKDSLDIYITNKSELCYEDVYCTGSYKLFFSSHCDSCMESYFLYNCRNCKDCIACTNLRHKQYHILNKSYSKKEYFEKIKELDLDSHKGLLKLKEQFNQLYYKSIHRFGNITKSVDIVGNEIANCKKCYYVFDAKDCENLKYVNWAGFGYPLKDSYDCGPGAAMAELLYEAVNTGLGGGKNIFNCISWANYDTEYVYHCRNSRDLFGCVGLRNKNNCILNKEYPKKEYEELVVKIRKHMNEMPYKDKVGNVYKYGEFFPIELSPYSYNETVAQEAFPLTQDQIDKLGYPSFKRPKAEYKSTIKAKDLPDKAGDVDKNILDEVIECGNNNCVGSGVFKLIPREVKFYKKQNLPLPRLCPLCRHYERIKRRNPMKLWERQCMKKGCNTKFQTTYSPDRKEIVYCEKCYQKEVE